MPRTRKKLQPIQAAPGQEYGQRKAQEDAQRAIPLPTQPQVTAPSPAPVTFGAFNRPTERPDEPITAGLTLGAGAGPEALDYQAGDNLVDLFSALYRAYPTEEIRGLLEEAQTRAGEI